MGSEQKNQILSLLKNKGVFGLRGTVGVSFGRFDSFSIPTAQSEVNSFIFAAMMFTTDIARTGRRTYLSPFRI